MDNNLSTIYNQYLNGLEALMKLPAELKNMLATAIRDQSTADAELEKEVAAAKARLSKLKVFAEAEYTKVQQELAGVDIPIPPRQRPSGGTVNLSATQAFDNQIKASESVMRIIQQIRNIERHNETEARNATSALEQRKRLAEERLKREEQEREQERQRLQREAEQRRFLEEQQRLEAQRNAEAMRKKSNIGCGTLTMIGLLLTIVIILLIFS